MVNSEQERSSSRSWPQKMKSLDPILYYSFLLVSYNSLSLSIIPNRSVSLFFYLYLFTSIISFSHHLSMLLPYLFNSLSIFQFFRLSFFLSVPLLYDSLESSLLFLSLSLSLSVVHFSVWKWFLVFDPPLSIANKHHQNLSWLSVVNFRLSWT